MRKLLVHHLSGNKFIHPAASKWYTWPVLYHPITLRTERVGLQVRPLSTIGNPLLWWCVSLALAATAGAAALRLGRGARLWLRRGAEPPGKSGSAGDNPFPIKAALFALACWATALLPWIFTGRDSYMYHYLPAYGFGLVLLAGLVEWIFRRRPKAARAFVLLALAVSVYFAPVAAQIPVSQKTLEHILVFPRWR